MELQDIGQVLYQDVGHDVSLRYLHAGSGAPLILMHTIRTQLDYFQEVIPRLAEYFTVYAVDLPGHGYSTIDKTAVYDEPYFRQQIISFIEKLNLKDVTLVGESIGGTLALTIGAACPDRVKTIVASNPYDYEKRYGDGVRRGNLFANIVIGSFAVPILGAMNAFLENKLFLGIILRGGLRKRTKMPNGLLTEFNRVGYRRGYRYVERKTFSGWRSWRKAKDYYADVKAPVKLVYGEFDWSTSTERNNTAKALDVLMKTIPNTGHFAFIDNPQKLVDIVLAHDDAE